MLEITTRPAADVAVVEADALAIGVLDPPELAGVAETLDGLLGGRLSAFVESKEINGGPRQARHDTHR